jgi:hypothetical protein
MRYSVLAPTAVLSGTLALGCVEQQSPTPPVGNSPASPTFVQTEQQSGGAIIERGTLLVGFWFSDPERGLTTLIGVPASGISDLSACGGTEEPEPFEVFGVIRPTGAHKFLLKSREVSVAVWQFTTGPTLEDLCGVLGTNAPYAVGTARARYVDNDLELPIEPGANSASLHAQGTVTVVATGEELQYQAVSHGVIPPGGTFEDQRLLQEDIRLH